MSNFGIYERYNEYSTQMMDSDPKVRLRAVSQMMQLYYQAPELKISVISKLEQMAGDSDPTVASYAKRFLQQIDSGRETIPTYTRPEYQPEMQPLTGPSGTTTAQQQQQQQKAKNIILNVVCCIIFIIIYFVLTYFVF
jgi:hypothetical protein